MVRFLLCALIPACCAVSVSAQEDSIYFIQGLPHTIEDTATGVRRTDRVPTDSFRRLSPYQIPARVREALNEGQLYDNWENGELLLDRNTELFHVNLTADSTVRSWRFNKRGKVVSYQEYDVGAQ